LEPADIKVINLDLSNKDAVDRFMTEEKFDTVIHLAGQAGVRIPQKNWNHYVRDNLTGFSNLILASANQGISNFLYASSSSVYGNVDVSQNLSESNLDIRAISFYGATKRCNELLSQSISRATGMRSRGLRLFTVYGPWGRPDMIYFRIINSILNRSQFRLLGEGNVQRDFTYITDVERAIAMLASELATREKGFADIVNVGGGRPRSISDLILIAERLTGSQALYLRQPSYAGDVKTTCADFNYLEELIGTIPVINLEEGMSKFIDWAKSSSIVHSLDEWVGSVP
jgi:UDP-glucuronate 4-epimerase